MSTDDIDGLRADYANLVDQQIILVKLATVCDDSENTTRALKHSIDELIDTVAGCSSHIPGLTKLLDFEPLSYAVQNSLKCGDIKEELLKAARAVESSKTEIAAQINKIK